MKKINAVWEKRNLGLDVTEIVAENKDTVEELKSALDEPQAQYLVLKIPSGRVDLLMAAQEKEFRVIEMNYHLVRNLKGYTLPKLYDRFSSDLTFIQADSDNADKVIQEIKKGQLFVTDRIALDPVFTQAQAGQRYAFWSQDIVKNGGQICIVQFKGKSVGFGINFSHDGITYNAALGGLFPEYENKGLGFLSIHSNMVSILNQGGSKVETTVSSNNLPILRLHLIFGFDIDQSAYVLIKHQG